MRLEELNWMDVEGYLKQDDRLMIVLGATEQHGYLSLTTDVKIPLSLADAASERSGVPVAPPLNFGVSPYFLAYPGTISLRQSTFIDVVADIVRSLYGSGFRRLLFLNGHGGNDLARGQLTELTNELPGLRTAFYSWWSSHSVEAVAMRYELKSYHAGWIEAFPFTRVSELPEGKKLPPALHGLPGAQQARELYGDGVFGGPYQVSNEIMNEVYQAALDDVMVLLNF